jgi:CYTH domain-containing protein/predicted ATPase
MSSNTKRIVSIVLTGGPCGGKTTAKAKIKDYFEPRGWRVIIVPESATQLILSGIVPFKESSIAFQSALLSTQLTAESVAKTFAQHLNENVLLVFDRGIVDGSAFTPLVIWQSLIAEKGLTPITARDTRYDAVFHLNTAAKGAEAFYTLENNRARWQSPAEAIEKDDLILAAWLGHPHLRVIENTGDFDIKIGNLLREISTILGIPEPIERERKFLVCLHSLPSEVENSAYTIVQTYLPKSPDSDQQLRLRRRGRNGEWMYIQTCKRPIPGDPTARYEVEVLLSAQDYWKKITEPRELKELTKQRAYALHQDGGQTLYLEIDRYMSFDPKPQCNIPIDPWAIVEVETDRTDNITLPNWCTILEEVTLRPEWLNVSLARDYLSNPYINR